MADKLKQTFETGFDRVRAALDERAEGTRASLDQLKDHVDAKIDGLEAVAPVDKPRGVDLGDEFFWATAGE